STNRPSSHLAARARAPSATSGTASRHSGKRRRCAGAGHSNDLPGFGSKTTSGPSSSSGSGSGSGGAGGGSSSGSGASTAGGGYGFGGPRGTTPARAASRSCHENSVATSTSSLSPSRSDFGA